MLRFTLLPFYLFSSSAALFALFFFTLMPSCVFGQAPPMYVNSYYGYGNFIDQTKMSNYVAMLRYARQFGWNTLELDDGWQAGLTTNNITLVDSNKFPGGLAELFKMIHTNGFNAWIYTELRTNTDGYLYGTGTNLIGNAQVFATNYLVDGVIFHGNWNAPADAAMADMLTFGSVLSSNRPGIFLQSLNPNPYAAINDGFKKQHAEFFSQYKPQTGYSFADFISTLSDAQAALYLFNANRDSIRPGHYLVPLNASGYPDDDPVIQVHRASLTINSLMSCGFVTGSAHLQDQPPINSLYCNPDVIAVCQDPAVIPASLAKRTITGTGTNEIWVKPLGGTNTATKAVGLFNWDTNHSATLSFTAADVNLPTTIQFVVYNCWSNAVSGYLSNNAFSISMPGGTVQLFKLYMRMAPLTLTINGVGTVSPKLNGQSLEVGKSYAMTAKPGAGYVFSNWSGSIIASTPKLIFIMQPNTALQANFIPNPFIPITGTYQGLFYDTNSVTLQSSGFFRAKSTSQGNFTAKLQLAGKSYSLSGPFSISGLASNILARSGLNPLTVLLKLDLNGGDELTGRVSDGTWAAELLANRAVFNPKTNPAPQAGKYTLLIPGGDDSSAQPGGDGFGAATVNGSGNVEFTGTLADGTKVAQTTIVSAQGQWPFYCSLYSGKGLILGWLTFTNETSDDINGSLGWIKLAQPTAKFCTAGLTNEMAAIGSKYAFTNGIPVLNFCTGQVWLEYGNQPESFTNRIIFGANKVINLSGNKLSLTLTASSGLFKGIVVNPVTGKAIPINGAVLQKQNIGSGYFLGTNQSGRVYFGP